MKRIVECLASAYLRLAAIFDFRYNPDGVAAERKLEDIKRLFNMLSPEDQDKAEAMLKKMAKWRGKD